jgi:Ca-activated chloride channel family protein
VRWQSPEFLTLLWLLPAAALLVWWSARLRSRDERALGDPEALRRRWGAPASWTRAARRLLLLLALAAGVTALARPQAGLRLVSTTSVGPDVVIALDLSESMRARDVKPDRLGAARRETAALLRALEGSAVGLVGFAGRAQVLSPLTTDVDGLQDRLEAANPEEMEEPGSDLSAGIGLAARLLQRPGERPRAVVLVTDGEQLDGDPAATMSQLRASRARLVIVGVGTPGGASIPVVDSTGAIRNTKRDESGSEVWTKLEEAKMRALAKTAGGRYERADGSGVAGRRAAAATRGEERGDATGRSLQAYDERFHWLAALAAFLLAAEAFVPRRERS